MSRSCWRKRSRLPDRSPKAPRIWPSRTSRRDRVIITSPTWLTRRSSSAARTRTDWLAAGRNGAMGGVVGRNSLAAAAAAGAGVCPDAAGTRGTTTAGAGTPSLAATPGCGAATTVSCTCSLSTRSASKLACRPSKLASKGSTCATCRFSESSRSMADSSRCASSPRRMAPAKRELPLSVCKVRSASWRALLLSGRAAHWRSAPPRRGNNSMASSSKMGNRSGSITSTASMSSSMLATTGIAWAWSGTSIIAIFSIACCAGASGAGG